MNYGQIKTQVELWAHRDDLADRMPEFVDNVSQRLGERFGVMPAPLVVDTDTNSLLTTHSRLYLVGCQVEVSMYTHDSEAVAQYEALFQEALSQMNINYQDLDWAACASPVVCPIDDNVCCPEVSPA